MEPMANTSENAPTSALTSRAPDPETLTPGQLLRQAKRLIDQAQELLDQAVVAERLRGTSWETIGGVLDGVTKSAAQKRYGVHVNEWVVQNVQPVEVDDEKLKLPDFPKAYEHLLNRWKGVGEVVASQDLLAELSNATTAVSGAGPADQVAALRPWANGLHQDAHGSYFRQCPVCFEAADGTPAGAHPTDAASHFRNHAIDVNAAGLQVALALGRPNRLPVTLAIAEEVERAEQGERDEQAARAMAEVAEIRERVAKLETVFKDTLSELSDHVSRLSPEPSRSGPAVPSQASGTPKASDPRQRRGVRRDPIREAGLKARRERGLSD